MRYYPRSSLAGLSKQLMRYGRGRVRLLRKHPNTLSVRTFLPALFVASCGIGAITMWLSPTIAAAYILALAAYLLLIVAASIATSIYQRRAMFCAILPLVFVTIHTSAGTGLLLRMDLVIRKKSRVKMAVKSGACVEVQQAAMKSCEAIRIWNPAIAHSRSAQQ